MCYLYKNPSQTRAVTTIVKNKSFLVGLSFNMKNDRSTRYGCVFFVNVHERLPERQKSLATSCICICVYMPRKICWKSTGTQKKPTKKYTKSTDWGREAPPSPAEGGALWIWFIFS